MTLIPKTITITYLLRNPAKVRALIAQGMKLSVEFEDHVVMVITPPQKTKVISEPHPPQYNMANPDWKQNRDEIHNKEY